MLCKWHRGATRGAYRRSVETLLTPFSNPRHVLIFETQRPQATPSQPEASNHVPRGSNVRSDDGLEPPARSLHASHRMAVVCSGGDIEPAGRPDCISRSTIPGGAGRCCCELGSACLSGFPLVAVEAGPHVWLPHVWLPSRAREGWTFWFLPEVSRMRKESLDKGRL